MSEPGATLGLMRPRPAWFALLLAVLVGLPACASTEGDPVSPGHEEPVSEQPGYEPPLEEEPSQEEPPESPLGPTVRVTRAVDGDTIHVALKGSDVTIRFIGIDTPETVHPTEPVECFGRKASAFVKDRLTGKRVVLEFDIERLDQYGRTLAYIWLRGKLFNEMLLAEGYAQVTTYPPNVKYVDRFLGAQRAAREAGRGLWSACGT